MMSLFDEEEILKSYIESERYDAAKEQAEKTASEMARKLIRKNKMSREDIADITGLTIDKIQQLEAEIMQPI
jgi:hypothetical protein